MSAGTEVHGVVGFGASAGGVEALSTVAAGLDPELAYAYLMVLHLPARGPSILARIIDRSGCEELWGCVPTRPRGCR